MPTAENLGIDSVQDVVESVYGLEGRVQGDEFRIHCPNPGHEDPNPSCDVNLVSGLWHCFSCYSSGDIVGLGSLVLDLPRSEVEARIRPNSVDSLQSIITRKLHRLLHPPRRLANLRLPMPEDYHDGPMLYLRQRGISGDTCRRWGARFVSTQTLEGSKGPFTIKNSIALPVRDESGRLLAWTYRRTDDSPPWQPRYVNTPGIKLSEYWFGVHLHAKAKEIVVVEGPLDAMWVDQMGIPALGLLGGEMGERKIRWLRRFDKVILLGDRNSAGVLTVQRIGTMLNNEVPVAVARYAPWMPGGDPQEMQPVDLEIALARAIPWTAWLMRQPSALSA